MTAFSMCGHKQADSKTLMYLKDILWCDRNWTTEPKWGFTPKIFQEAAEDAYATYVIHGKSKYQKCLPDVPLTNIGYYYILLVLKKSLWVFQLSTWQ